MKRVIKASTYKVGVAKKPGLDAVLEFIGFTFLPDDPDIAMMLDPADKTAVDIYDAKDGSITRYEGANTDGMGLDLYNAMKDMDNLNRFIADNNVHIVETDLENIVY